MSALLTQLDPFTNIPYAELAPIGQNNGAFLSQLQTMSLGQGGNNVLRADQQGIWLGGATFATALWSVTMAGAMTASSFTLTGGTIKYGKTAFTDTVHAGYFISGLGFYFGSANNATMIKYTTADGTIDHIGTISGRDTIIVASAISAVGHFIDDRLNTDAKQILSDFTFGVSGALQIGVYSPAVSGDIRIAPTGIVARNSSNITTFALNGTTGAATFGGTLAAPDGTIGGWTLSATRLYAGSGSTAAGMATDGTIRFFAGASDPTLAPFNVAESGNTRVNVLTNKSILFETITAPAAVDGQLWCAVNAANKNVLWGYFGGDTTNKQQISMSRMFAYAEKDNDNTAGGATMTTDVVIATWFQPRSVDAKCFFIDSTNNKIGVAYGFAQNGQVGVSTGMAIEASQVTNVVSGLSFGTASNVVAGNVLETQADPKIPAVIDAGGHVTSFYNIIGKNSVVGTGWGPITALTSANWTNNSMYVLSAWRVWQQGDCILASNYAVDRTTLNVYAYVLSWTDTSVTIRVVSKVGWRGFVHFNCIG